MFSKTRLFHFSYFFSINSCSTNALTPGPIKINVKKKIVGDDSPKTLHEKAREIEKLIKSNDIHKYSPTFKNYFQNLNFMTELKQKISRQKNNTSNQLKTDFMKQQLNAAQKKIFRQEIDREITKIVLHNLANAQYYGSACVGSPPQCFEVIYDTGSVLPTHAIMCKNPQESGQDGQLVIGDVDHQAFLGDLNWIPVSNHQQDYWMLDIEKVTIMDEEIIHTKDYQMRKWKDNLGRQNNNNYAYRNQRHNGGGRKKQQYPNQHRKKNLPPVANSNLDAQLSANFPFPNSKLRCGIVDSGTSMFTVPNLVYDQIFNILRNKHGKIYFSQQQQVQQQRSSSSSSTNTNQNQIIDQSTDLITQEINSSESESDSSQAPGNNMFEIHACQKFIRDFGQHRFTVHFRDVEQNHRSYDIPLSNLLEADSLERDVKFFSRYCFQKKKIKIGAGKIFQVCFFSFQVLDVEGLGSELWILGDPFMRQFYTAFSYSCPQGEKNKPCIGVAVNNAPVLKKSKFFTNGVLKKII